jgi:protein gp37
MGKTKIDWCDRVWNPTTGCTKVSQGCKNCYAERMAEHFWKDRKFSKIYCHPDRLTQPLSWRKQQKVFVDSMGDLFHPDVPEYFIAQVLAICAIAKQHIFMILTKRADRMKEFFSESSIWKEIEEWAKVFVENGPSIHGLPENIWLGVSVEDQVSADERIPLLLQTPAAIRFVSYEPALEIIDFSKYQPFCRTLKTGFKTVRGILAGEISWLIQGCESGPGARPMDIEWARSVRDQCQAVRVPFFLKQMMVDGKLVHMPVLDGKIWDQFPEVK